jgi:capsular exopolysaccharide synthesis family protein
MSNIFDALKRREKRSQGRPPGAAPPVLEPESRAEMRPMGKVSFQASRELERLRERLDLELPRTGRRVIAVAASITGEGSSTVSLQLARSIVRSGGGPVLLVDADLRRQGRSLTLAIPSAVGRPGLMEVLDGAADLSKAVLSTDEPNLHFLPAGGGSGRPVDAIPLDRMRQFLDDMGQVYGVVLIDCPSILENPEIPTIAALSDGIVLVVRANRTRREVVQRALLLIQNARCRVLGIVLNQRRYPLPGFIYRRL